MILPLRLEQAAFSAGGREIIAPLTLEIGAGASTVILGANGAGKSVLMRLMHGLLAPTLGRVAWSESDARRVRRQQAMVFQRPVMLRRSALANIVYALEVAGIAVSERRERALARDPEVLFLDEPTASLDPAATKAIEDVIRAVVARGIKVVMSTHDLGEARRLAGEIVLMHRGRMLECSTAETFFSAPKTEEARRFAAGELLV